MAPPSHPWIQAADQDARRRLEPSVGGGRIEPMVPRYRIDHGGPRLAPIGSASEDQDLDVEDKRKRKGPPSGGGDFAGRRALYPPPAPLRQPVPEPQLSWRVSANFNSGIPLVVTFTNPQDGVYFCLLTADMQLVAAGAQPATPTITGDLTWTLVQDIGTAVTGSPKRLMTWVALMSPVHPATVTASLDGGANALLTAQVRYTQGLTLPLVQSLSGEAGAAPPLTLDLADFASESNVGIGLTGTGGGAGYVGPPGWTQISGAASDFVVYYHIRSADAVWQFTAGTALQAIAMEAVGVV